jgi:hypothetical protein
MSVMEVEVATATQARELTDRIKVAVEGSWQLIKQAYTTRAWEALGYSSWDDYCTRAAGPGRVNRPGPDQRTARHKLDRAAVAEILPSGGRPCPSSMLPVPTTHV